MGLLYKLGNGGANDNHGRLVTEFGEQQLAIWERTHGTGDMQL
jgi:hypothetical protein